MRRLPGYPADVLTARDEKQLTKAVEQAVRQVVEQAIAALAVSINYRLQRIERQLAIDAKEASQLDDGRRV